MGWGMCGGAVQVLFCNRNSNLYVAFLYRPCYECYPSNEPQASPSATRQDLSDAQETYDAPCLLIMET